MALDFRRVAVRPAWKGIWRPARRGRGCGVDDQTGLGRGLSVFQGGLGGLSVLWSVECKSDGEHGKLARLCSSNPSSQLRVVLMPYAVQTSLERSMMDGMQVERRARMVVFVRYLGF